MRRSKPQKKYVPEIDEIHSFAISLTDRQMQLVNMLKSMGGRVSRYRLLWEFGVGVDSVACSLIQKGLLSREREGGKVYYALTKLGRGEI